ncbi:hypothetical protein, conserved [Trypanosoma brucei gambiense DAL972]|uniref:Uncharacterized protein n=2 Tax=Trypanosoma brucei TaxID=5691 RepID=D0A1L0_TRYB9|nr:hypothetical protein, conserved [Trypanosoma brucei gambiense DAL972]RHW69026.1 hypothetical protein DPX39_100024600 [Trypanosoma brucei equiperdum]CBH15152.1 hypothetical protein, conserved [Trypanosoma brucei gambiense DAL972]|eukprot:XP_011777418.1 hypothetical protein, conserved [Trypanosoma brucei gambiense DAL972]
MSNGYKRERWDEESGDHYHQHAVRYSDLPPNVKLQRRRQERQEKKEKERTLAYFTSVHRALEEQSAETLVAFVDGFFVELIKLLRADTSLHLLRNGTVCRTIEAALASSQLLHCKSLLYILLGHVYDLAASPTASRTLEAIIASIVRGVSVFRRTDSSAFSAEMEEGGASSNGVPSASTLITCVVEELAERAGEVLLHDAAARAVRSIILFLGGFWNSTGTASSLPHGVKFYAQLDTLGTALMCVVEPTFGVSCGDGVANIWLQVAKTPTASFVVQSLLRVCERETKLDTSVRQRLEVIHNDGSQLLRQLLMDPLGCHLFQAYLRVPVPASVLKDYDSFSSYQCSGTAPTSSGSGKRFIKMLRDVAAEEPPNPDELAHEKTCWDKALAIVVEALDDLLDPAGSSVGHAVFALQDLVLFAPTAVHLERVWEQLLERIGLRTLLASPKLVQVLIVFTRKCAFSNPLPTVVESEDRSAEAAPLEGGFVGDMVPKDVEQSIYNDLSQGVRYFPTSTEFQKKVLTALLRVARELCPKGAAQFLLVDGGLQDKGFELARYIMHFVPAASAVFLHAIERLRRSDVETLLYHPKGSLVFQQFLRAGAAHHPQGKKGGEQQQQQQRVETMIPLSFMRRISPLLPRLVVNTYAAYVIEVLYDVGSFEVKEELVKALLPIYNEMKRSHEEKQREVREAASRNDPSANPNNFHMSEFITRKVMTKCLVEMYSHRPDDWAKLARRQCQVQRLLQRMSSVAF